MYRLIDKTILTLYMSEDNYRLVFRTSDGEYYAYGADGDCCSVTWFAELNGYSALKNATILEVDNSYSYSSVDDPKHDCLQSYGIKIRTNKGYVDIVYRNSSNGYYGGSCAFEGVFSSLEDIAPYDARCPLVWKEIKGDFSE